MIQLELLRNYRRTQKWRAAVSHWKRFTPHTGIIISWIMCITVSFGTGHYHGAWFGVSSEHWAGGANGIEWKKEIRSWKKRKHFNYLQLHGALPVQMWAFTSSSSGTSPRAESRRYAVPVINCIHINCVLTAVCSVHVPRTLAPAPKTERNIVETFEWNMQRIVGWVAIGFWRSQIKTRTGNLFQWACGSAVSHSHISSIMGSGISSASSICVSVHA